MTKNIFIYGKSEIASRVNIFFEASELFNAKIVDYFPKQKVDGLVLCFIDDMSFSEVLELAQTVKSSSNDSIFISTYSKKQIVIGTTYLSQDTACIDSVLYYLLYQKYHFSNEEEVNRIRIPKFDNLLQDYFYEKSFHGVVNKIVKEIKKILDKI